MNNDNTKYIGVNYVDNKIFMKKKKIKSVG